MDIDKEKNKMLGDREEVLRNISNELKKIEKYEHDEIDDLVEIRDIQKEILKVKSDTTKKQLALENSENIVRHLQVKMQKHNEVNRQFQNDRTKLVHKEYALKGKMLSIEKKLFDPKIASDVKNNLSNEWNILNDQKKLNVESLRDTELKIKYSDDEIDRLQNANIFHTDRVKYLGLEIQENSKIQKQLEESVKWKTKYVELLKSGRAILETITSPFLLLAGFLAIGLKRFVELDSAAKDFRNTTKLTKDQTVELVDQVETMSLEYGKFGIGVKEGYAATAALVDQFGTANKAVTENVRTVALLTANLGVTNDNAAGFVRYMDQVGNMTKEQVANTAGFAKNLSKASGVPLDSIMKDVADASDQARAMTGGSVVNLIKASAQARKLGVDLNKVAAAARGMLDFNESINAELEASVLLGKNLSFMDARRYAFAGQLEKAQEATLSQIEKMGDFNALNVLQQEALAKASGYSVSDLQKMIKLKKDFNSLNREEKDNYSKLMKMKEEDIKNNNSARDELKKMQMQSTMDTLNNSLSTLKNSLAQLLIPILKFLTPIIEGFSIIVGKVGEITSSLPDWAQGLGGIVTLATLLGLSFFGISSSISKIISMGGKLAGALSKGVVGESGPQQPGMMGKLGNWMSGKFGKTAGDISKAAGSVDPKAGKGFSEFMGSLSNGLNKISMNGVLKGAAALFIIGASLIPFAYAAKLLSEVSWEDIGKAAVGLGLLTVATLAIGAVMSSGVGTVAILAGAAAFILLGSALIPFGYGAKLAGEGMNLVGDGLSKIVPQLSSLVGMSAGLSVVTKSIIELGNAFNSFGVGSSDGLGKLLDTRVSQLQKLVDVGPQLQVTANAIKTISNPSADNSSSSSSSASSNEAVVKKLDELIGLMKSGAIAVNLDGRRVSSGLAAAVS